MTLIVVEIHETSLEVHKAIYWVKILKPTFYQNKKHHFLPKQKAPNKKQRMHVLVQDDLPLSPRCKISGGCDHTIRRFPNLNPPRLSYLHHYLNSDPCLPEELNSSWDKPQTCREDVPRHGVPGFAEDGDSVVKGWGDSPTRLLGRWNGKCDAAVVGHDLLDFLILELCRQLRCWGRDFRF